MNTSRKAFTLIELLVTVAIFSLIASISYSVLSTSFKSKEIQNTHSDELFKLQKTLNFIERDISQISNQNIMLNANGLTFSTFQNDELLFIQYAVSSNQLLRKDITSPSKPVALELLDQVNNLSVRLLDHEGQWLLEMNINENTMIKAIEIKLKHPFWGDLTKLVLIDD